MGVEKKQEKSLRAKSFKELYRW